MTRAKSTLIGPPLIGSWVPYLVGREYRRELYDLFLYDGQIVPAMTPSVSEVNARDINWVYVGQAFPDTLEPGRVYQQEGHYVIPHQYIVAVRLMTDEAIRQQGVIWPIGVERQAKMKQAFLYRTTGRRYPISEVYRIAKDIVAAVHDNAEPKCVLNILKTRFRDVIDK